MSKETQKSLIPDQGQGHNFERNFGDLPFIMLIVGWLILFVLVPPLAVFLFFVPSMFGQAIDSKTNSEIARFNLEQELASRDIPFDKSSSSEALSDLLQADNEQRRIRRIDESIRRAMELSQ